MNDKNSSQEELVAEILEISTLLSKERASIACIRTSVQDLMEQGGSLVKWRQINALLSSSIGSLRSAGDALMLIAAEAMVEHTIKVGERYIGDTRPVEAKGAEEAHNGMQGEESNGVG